MPIAGGLEFAEMECRCPSEIVGFDEHRRVADPARKVDRFVDQLRRLAKIGAHVIDVSEPSYRGEEIRVVVKLPAQFLGALIDSLRFA